ncbi:MAG: DUF3078 domain-containing protein [Bacteroidales bacterium]
MKFHKYNLVKLVSVVFILFLSINSASSQTSRFQQESANDSLDINEAVNILKDIYYDEDWQSISDEARELLQGLIVYAQYPNIDSLKTLYQRTINKDGFLVYRNDSNFKDSLKLRGYKSYSQIQQEKEKLAKDLRTSINPNDIKIPEHLYKDISKSVKTVPPGQGHTLFLNGTLDMSQKMSSYFNSIDTSRGNEQKRIIMMLSDSVLYSYMEKERQEYNNHLMSKHIDSINTDFTNKVIDRIVAEKQEVFAKESISSNLRLIRDYNTHESRSTNNLLKDVCMQVFDYIYHRPSQIQLRNGDNTSQPLLMQNGQTYSRRFWVRNPQNDSLSLMIKSVDLNTIEMFVADNVMFQRMQEQQKKELKKLNTITVNKDIPDTKDGIHAYQPWTYETNTTLTFSQVAMNKYWAKGGDDAFSLLTILNGKATYSMNRVNWANAILIEEGWNSAKDEPVKSTHDRLRINSDLSIKAINKWYYSSGIEFETQLFTTYSYPKDADKVPLYGLLNPGTFRYNLGIQYKPKDNFQVRLSPFTLKYVFYTDTSKYNQTLQGVDKYSTSLFDKGFEAEINYNTKLLEKCKLTSRYRMFFEYADFANSADLLWENHLFIDLTERINLNLRMDLYYNANQKVPVYEIVDGTETKVDEKAGLQIKEFFSVGFTWSLYRKPTKIRNKYRYY